MVITQSTTTTCNQAQSNVFTRLPQQKNSQFFIPVMNRRGLNNAGTNLGDSTSCLLTFQHDMLESSWHRPHEDIDNAFCEMSLDSQCNKYRSFSGYSDSDDDVVPSSYGKARSSSAYCVRSGDEAQKRRGKPSSSTAHCLRQDDAPKPLSRIKPGSHANIFEVKAIRSKSGTISHEMLHGNDNQSVSTAIESRIPSRSNVCVKTDKTVDSKPRESHRLSPPPGRLRPGIRTHRSGSFALRQFKENYDQKQNRRPKTKAEARFKKTIENEVVVTNSSFDSTSDHSEKWMKPALRPYRSAHGSFRSQVDAKCINSTDEISSACDKQSRSIELPVDHSSTELAGGTDFKRSTIEVAPGCEMLFCGIDETMNALHLDRIIHVECTSCNIFLACINVASMVLCPGCQTVGPSGSTSHSVDCVPTIGLGLRVEDILAHVGK